MHRISYIAMAAGIAFGIGGCNGFPGNLFGGGDTAEEPPTSTPVVISPTVEPEADSAAEPDAAERVATLPRNLDLIPSTNPEQRLQAIQSERSDPFSIVATTPSVQIVQTNGTTPPGSTAVPPVSRPAPTTRASGSGGGASGSGSGSGGLAPIPNLVPQRPGSTTATRTAPPPPQPTLARAVEVLGVVQVGNTPYAIINAPNEPTSRYVREGQSLSNGQVVVRRIEMNGPEPAVVFEQFGIEVITAVGGGGTPDTGEGSPAAALPASANQG